MQPSIHTWHLCAARANTHASMQVLPLSLHAPAVHCPRRTIARLRLILIDCQTNTYTRRASAHSLTSYTPAVTDIAWQRTKTIRHSNSLLGYSTWCFWTPADKSAGFWTRIRHTPNVKIRLFSNRSTPCGRGTVASIVYCRCTYWCPETNSWENNLTYFTILCCGILLWAQVWTVIHTSWAWC